MKQLQINDQELAAALRRMAPETGSLICLGCGYERNCSLHGCAVLRAAADRLVELSAQPPNPPLTLEELREMDGEPVWVELVCKNSPIFCAIVHGNRVTDGRMSYDTSRTLLSLDRNGAYGVTWLAYRRKPEEGTTWQQ